MHRGPEDASSQQLAVVVRGRRSSAAPTPSHLVKESQKPGAPARRPRCSRPAAAPGRKPDHRRRPGWRRRAVRAAAGRRAVSGAGEMGAVTVMHWQIFCGAALPLLEDRVDLLRLVEELGQRGVRGRLQGVAGVAVEELGELLRPPRSIACALLHQRRCRCPWPRGWSAGRRCRSSP